jgi:hypothetical protein
VYEDEGTDSLASASASASASTLKLIAASTLFFFPASTLKLNFCLQLVLSNFFFFQLVLSN